MRAAGATQLQGKTTPISMHPSINLTFRPVCLVSLSAALTELYSFGSRTNWTIGLDRINVSPTPVSRKGYRSHAADPPFHSSGPASHYVDRRHSQQQQHQQHHAPPSESDYMMMHHNQQQHGHQMQGRHQAQDQGYAYTLHHTGMGRGPVPSLGDPYGGGGGGGGRVPGRGRGRGGGRGYPPSGPPHYGGGQQYY
jgi:hypothetical protein